MPMRVLLAGLASLSLLVAGCSSERDESTSRSSELTIPVILDLTGLTKSVGKGIVQRTLQFAADEVNASGELGDRKIKLEFFDDAGDKAKAVQIFKSVARDDSNILVMGPLNTGPLVATHPLAGQDAITQLAPWSGGVWPGDYQNHQTFRMAIIENAVVISQTVDAIMKLHPEIKVVGDFIATDSPFNVSAAPFWKQAFEDHGVKVVQTEITTSTTDFSAQLNSLAAAHPQAIIQRNATPVGIPLLKQAKERGMDVFVLGTALTYGYTAPWVSDGGLGNDLDNRVLYSSYWDPKNPATASFIKDFREKFGIDPSYYDALSYDAIHVVAKAIETAGSDLTRASIYDAMKTMTFNGVFGKYTWPDGCCDVQLAGHLQLLTYQKDSEVPAR
jgi:branched-chain amino acid transport system substrate-binding protein